MGSVNFSTMTGCTFVSQSLHIAIKAALKGERCVSARPSETCFACLLKDNFLEIVSGAQPNAARHLINRWTCTFICFCFHILAGVLSQVT